MVVLPLSRLPQDYDANMNTPRPVPAPKSESIHWLRIASAATLVTGGALLLSGKRRTGLFVAATGTALALLDQQDLLIKWWTILPAYIDDIQELLNQAEGAVEEFAVQRERLGKVLSH
jgi:hypothetical protein